jgi:hypothetical protein
MKSALLTLTRPGLSSPLARLSLLALLAGAALLCGTAQAGVQWKWKDANGAIQYSDRPPPAGTPEQNVLSRPVGVRAPVNRSVDAASGASAPSAAASSGVDPELEARRKKAEEDKRGQKKAEEDKQASQRVDNCQRARGYQRSLEEGLRITRTSPSGEREVLDDRGRAEEMQRTQEVISSNCK